MKNIFLGFSHICQKFKTKKSITWLLNFPKKSSFWYPLILSLLSATIFYYFFSVIPRQHEYEKIKPQVEYLTDKILWDGMFIVTEMTHENITQDKYHYGDITITEFENALKGNHFDTKLRYVTVNHSGEWYNIGDFVADYLSNIKTNADVLFRYIIYLDPEEINIINELLRNDLFEVWNNARFPDTMRIDGKIYTAERKDLSAFKQHVYNFYQTLQKLDKYAHENIYAKLKSLRIKANNAYFAKRFNLSIEYNLQILKLQKNDKDALFYYGASLLAENQIPKGIEVLTKFLQLYPEQIQFLKSNIDNEFAINEILKKIK
ncbi:hypothetical protein [uncultured Draconibacterium sp.]|uniref:hypothetical protein n=1 Tax=uncultured Draconibacterium sp. TaxID=1573823 RepID=UPI00321631B7